MKKRKKQAVQDTAEKTDSSSESVFDSIEKINAILSKSGIDGKAMTFDSRSIQKVPVIRTGIPSLDVALGVGGLPKGRIIEVYGQESSGKSTLVFSIIANAQKEGLKCGIVDAEHALDISWVKKCGVDVDKLIIFQPDCGEDALECCNAMLLSKVNFVAVDSVAALVPKVEIDGEMGDVHIGLQARLMSQAMRKLVGVIKRKQSVAIFINQIRNKINTGGFGGSPYTTSGGNALKFYASVRLDIARTGSNKDKNSKGDEDVNVKSNNIRIKVVKNKVAPPFKICTAVLNFESGFCTEYNIFKSLIGSRIRKKGSWFVWDNQDQMGQGEDAAYKWFLESTDKGVIKDLYDEYLETNIKGE